MPGGPFGSDVPQQLPCGRWPPKNRPHSSISGPKREPTQVPRVHRRDEKWCAHRWDTLQAAKGSRVSRHVRQRGGAPGLAQRAAELWKPAGASPGARPWPL